jgi:hypothetical protein
MFLSVHGGHSRISIIASCGVHHRCFLVLLGDDPGSPTPPPRGPTIDILQLSGSHFQTSSNASHGATMSIMFFTKKNWFLALLRT